MRECRFGGKVDLGSLSAFDDRSIDRSSARVRDDDDDDDDDEKQQQRKEERIGQAGGEWGGEGAAALPPVQIISPNGS